MKKLILGIATFVVVVIVYSIMTHHALVSVNEDVHNKWAQVKKEYYRKSESIHNLVNSVKEYVDNESTVLTGIENSRSGYENAKSLFDFVRLDANLSILLEIIVEEYPNLKVDENFLRLQDELASNDKRVEIARENYIDSVTKYNKKINNFPTSVFANMFGFKKIDAYTVH
ncbi:LemA family protein [Oceanirhabdus seepicola]|uniref:LemA family protein n=1 Tax=Oceanirhabdus seepicola TaxID=2828781 RepID=A0A9J6P5T2_9CLOT|nr:LemA family protein [Oceanirhabdus seepicola]MCM1991955.1 LemA family protein [Oceanirhabdus seepicola]